MKRDQIIVLIKSPKKEPIIKTIPNTEKAFRSIVDGNYEIIDVKKNVVMIDNEDCRTVTRFANKYNFAITSKGEYIDTVKGTAFFCSRNGEDFDDIGSSDVLDLFYELGTELYPDLEVDFT